MARSPKDVLAEFESNLPKLQESLHGPMTDFTKRFMPGVLKPGALTTKEKELIVLGIAVCSRCDYCIALHVKKCVEAGATKEEMVETLGVAMLMGGGPAFTYSVFAMEAIEEFTREG